MQHRPHATYHKRNYTAEKKLEAEEEFMNGWNVVQTRTRIHEKEEELIEWMEQVIQRKILLKEPDETTQEPLGDALKSGKLLCRLINGLVPGSIPNIPKNPPEAISLFLQKCLEFGVPQEQLFYPEELLGAKRNMVQVLYCIHALAEHCHDQRVQPYFTGADRKERREAWQKATNRVPISHTSDVSPVRPRSLRRRRTKSEVKEENGDDQIKEETTAFPYEDDTSISFSQPSPIHDQGPPSLNQSYQAQETPSFSQPSPTYEAHPSNQSPEIYQEQGPRALTQSSEIYQSRETPSFGQPSPTYEAHPFDQSSEIYQPQDTPSVSQPSPTYDQGPPSLNQSYQPQETPSFSQPSPTYEAHPNNQSFEIYQAQETSSFNQSSSQVYDQDTPALPPQSTIEYSASEITNNIIMIADTFTETPPPRLETPPKLTPIRPSVVRPSPIITTGNNTSVFQATSLSFASRSGATQEYSTSPQATAALLQQERFPQTNGIVTQPPRTYFSKAPNKVQDGTQTYFLFMVWILCLLFWGWCFQTFVSNSYFASD